ncbi:MAG: hypothetical protein Q8M32_10330 [Brevundimonas sp.]|uniref:DUF6789 family protein n=1 Tax=Brevundimonas sp. TaxID=1871086 RepID=UPI002727C4E5|nr:DUF6789 family protein [Brevundimonas sp.]MDO9589283.1 hypothetical protein [Brevundimonas sp.]MDP3370228.1 hypothetical protein [Brevundimonas sp.]
MMSRVQKGVIAGLSATVAVSLLEAANLYFGPWAASFPRLLSVMLQAPDLMIVGWIAHFLVGTFVFGAAFGVLCPRLPTDTPESKGILFAVGAFIVMGLTVAPLVGALGGRPVGIFFMQAGFGTLAWMIATHAIYGIVLGSVYGRLVERDKRAQSPAGAQTHGSS